MMLQATVQAGNRRRRFIALNEFTIAKSTLSRMIELEARVDGIYLTSFRADGLIVSTPTGSTAYCLSAGGPIVHPSMNCLVFIPICPHSLTSRPLVVPASSEIELRLQRRDTAAYLTVDGGSGMKLKERQGVKIRAAEKGFHLITSPSMDYYSILHTKLRWGYR
jgi:NAD+ kinase